ncbi:MAG: tetratricopeptide repeat protein [Bacteroidaceae bacterium]|nr:tetratricopeptide repeat protein [Bacteroidaceae bacterium]
MLSKEITESQQYIYNALKQCHLQKAFARLRMLSAQLQEWDADTKLNDLETSYRYMIQYLLDGIIDPKRTHVYNHLITATYHLTDVICDKLRVNCDMTLYYTTRKSHRIANKTLSQLYSALDNSVNELSLSELIHDNKSIIPKRKEVEHNAEDFFDKIWTNFPTHTDDYATLRDALQPHHLPESVSAMVVSAITLNIIHSFDETMIDILIDAYLHHDSPEVQIRALSGVLISVLHYHPRLHLYANLGNRLSLLHDNGQFNLDTRNILFQFIRSRDTEKISRKMTEEILPKMMKISPSLYKKIKEDDALNEIESLEQNPEWQELLEQTGVTDNLMELNELQMQGADVFMSTFAHLKGFSFFNSLANWLVPFVTNHSAVYDALGTEEWGKRFADILRSSGFLCNSDKYSFCLSLAHAPIEQRQMMASQFRTENAQMEEDAKAELYKKSRERESISNRYIQDLYRLIKLHPRRSEFLDIFSIPLNELLQIRNIFHITHEEKLLKSLGEYLFKNQYYNDAVQIFDILSHNNYTDSELFQKYAYCHQTLNNYHEALELYLKADLIKPNNVWTLRHIAICYRNLKKIDIALDYFIRANDIDPENLSINLNIGHCYLEQKMYDKALSYYYKVDYLDSKGTKARRPIAWCSFLAGKYEQAASWYQKILSATPTAPDYLNAAHVAWVRGNIREAINLYLQSIEADGNDIKRFTQNFEHDTQELIDAGIKQEDIPIILDQIVYQASEKKNN